MIREDYIRWFDNSPMRMQKVLKVRIHMGLAWLLRSLIDRDGYLVILIELVRELDRRARETNNEDERERLLKIVRDLGSVTGKEMER